MFDGNPDMWKIRRAQGGYIIVSLDDNLPEEENDEVSISYREHICLTPEEACLSLSRYLAQDIANFSPDDEELSEAIKSPV